MKISLPLIALVVLGTVFLITSDDEFDAGYTFSQAEFNALENGNFLVNPHINGTTVEGGIFSLAAEKIEPKVTNTNKFDVINLIANFDYPTGDSIEIASAMAEFDTNAQLLYFPDGAHVITSDGYDGIVKSLMANLETGEVSGKMIAANGPIGHISADSFHISTVVNDSTENRVLNFENSVKVILNTDE